MAKDIQRFTPDDSRRLARRLSRLLPRFNKLPIVVVGDLMVDKFVWGEVERISPEAPVPVVRTLRENYLPGGMGNVVNNLHTLGAKVYPVGVIGADPVGEFLLRDWEKLGIDIGGIAVDSTRPTILKTRIIARQQQVVRVDKESSSPLSPKIIQRVRNSLALLLPRCRAVIVSDYGKGTIRRGLIQWLRNYRRRNGLPIFVDPKIEHFAYYRGLSGLTPNLSETVAGMRSRRPKNEKELFRLGERTRRRLQAQLLLVTRGEEGMTLFEEKKITHIPTVARQVYDVTGAGDTVISVFTLAFALGVKPVEAALLANVAAGLVVAKLGTATVTPEELSMALNG